VQCERSQTGLFCAPLRRCFPSSCLGPNIALRASRCVSADLPQVGTVHVTVAKYRANIEEDSSAIAALCGDAADAVNTVRQLSSSDSVPPHPAETVLHHRIRTVAAAIGVLLPAGATAADTDFVTPGECSGARSSRLVGGSAASRRCTVRCVVPSTAVMPCAKHRCRVGLCPVLHQCLMFGCRVLRVSRSCGGRSQRVAAPGGACCW
jgi:hypothetical protein